MLRYQNTPVSTSYGLDKRKRCLSVEILNLSALVNISFRNNQESEISILFHARSQYFPCGAPTNIVPVDNYKYQVISE